MPLRVAASVLAGALFIAAIVWLSSRPAEYQVSDRNAYNPIPSPDGRTIVAVGSGMQRPGGSGGLGRSNLRSEPILLDRNGILLSRNLLGDSFVADWNQDGIVLYRDWSYALIAENGAVRQQGKTCEIQPPRALAGCVESVAYLTALHTFVWVQRATGYSVLITPGGEFSTYTQAGLSDRLAPSPDNRYVAAEAFQREGRRSLDLYDARKREWRDVGAVVPHPDEYTWNWMEATWSPWFTDSSHLVFFTDEGLVVSSPDGKQQSLVLRPAEPAGLAVPSPDGNAIAYATFRSHAAKPGSSPTWNCTGIWWVQLKDPSHPKRLTAETQDSTYDLRWMDNRHLVFDRFKDGFPSNARIWMVLVDR